LLAVRCILDVDRRLGLHLVLRTDPVLDLEDEVLMDGIFLSFAKCQHVEHSLTDPSFIVLGLLGFFDLQNVSKVDHVLASVVLNVLDVLNAPVM